MDNKNVSLIIYTMASRSSHFCYVCHDHYSNRPNYERHLKTSSHLKKKTEHEQNIILFKKSDYTIDNFIPLNLETKGDFNQHYYLFHVKFDHPKDASRVVESMFELFIRFHRLDEPGFLPPFLIREQILPKADKTPFISRHNHQYTVEVPQIQDNQLIWVIFERNLVNRIENQLESYYANKVLTEMIANDMQEIDVDEIYDYETGRSGEMKSCYEFLINGTIKTQFNRNFCDCFRINPSYLEHNPPKPSPGQPVFDKRTHLRINVVDTDPAPAPIKPNLKVTFVDE